MKKSFTFRKDQLNYELKLRRRPWWLLLLLLPLLLLIPFEKDVYVQTLDANTKSRIPGAEVHFDYTHSALFTWFRFFTNDPVNDKQITGKDGTAHFVKLKYTLYSWLFKHNSPALVWAANDCYASDTLKLPFHDIKSGDTLRLPMSPAMAALDFKTVDRADMSPLPQSKVTIIVELSGLRYVDTATTDAAGRVVFNRVPRCGRMVSVLGEHDGYYPDSIVNKQLSDLQGNLDAKRELKLKPIRKPVVFYVEDCKTHQPIAGAKVTVDFDFNGQKSSYTAITNTDGKGKGIYQDAYIIARVHLSGIDDYYQQGELPGQHVVRDFIDSGKYPRSKRTFCLEPKSSPLEFTDVDSVTNQPLAGAKNKVTVVNNAGAVHSVFKQSNSNGKFTVAVNPGDKISIVANFRPDYEENHTSVLDADGIKLLTGAPGRRIIPLAPVTKARPPTDSCRIFVSGIFVSDEAETNMFSGIYQVDQFSEYVGAGEYSDNTLAFPKAYQSTFDGLAIDAGTHVIIYSGKNFTGDVVLDQKGPAIINNGKYKDQAEHGYADALKNWQEKEFKPELQERFPPSVRLFSSSDMNAWSYGSMKVICDKN